MGGIFDFLFVIDVKKEVLVIVEVNKLGILVVVVVDINCFLDGVDYIISGNDDVFCVIVFYCDLVFCVVLDGMIVMMGVVGVDLGEFEEVLVEEVVVEELVVEVFVEV